VPQIEGPLTCEPVATACVGSWRALISAFSSIDFSVAPADGGVAPVDHGCGCTLGRRTPARGGLALLLVLAWVCRPHRRRRGVRSPQLG
jgi:hypothetical protein